MWQRGNNEAHLLRYDQRDNLSFKADPPANYAMSDVRVFEIDFTFTVGYKCWLLIGSESHSKLPQYSDFPLCVCVCV